MKEELQSLNIGCTLVNAGIDKAIDKLLETIDDAVAKWNLSVAMEEYLYYFYKKNIYTRSLAKQNCKQIIYKIYQPLEIYNRVNTSERYYINKLEMEIFYKHRNILLMDNAGMGKSTLIKYMSLSILENGEYVPYILELRNIEGEEIIEYIKNEIRMQEKNILTKDVEKLLRQGKFIIFFDGFDEVDDRYKTSVSNKIKRFVEKYSENYYMLSSRQIEGIGTFESFMAFSIRDLTFDEACELIRKLDNDGEISNNLIHLLKSKGNNYQNVRDLLGNPLLVMILYSTFECGECFDIPCKKSDFYEQIFQALYKRHDKMKDGAYEHQKKSMLDISDFYTLLRKVGFKCLQKNCKVIYSRLELELIVNNALNEMKWIKTKTADYLDDVTYAVPYFRVMNNYYVWFHKSFMEYFAAAYICNDLRELKSSVFEQLAKKSGLYYNVLDFCFEMDIRAFRIHIIYPLLKQYLYNYEEQYEMLEAQGVRKEDFNLRKSLLVGYQEGIQLVDEINKRNETLVLQKKFENTKCKIISKLKTKNAILISKEDADIINIIMLLKDKKVDIFEHKIKYRTIETEFLDIPNRYYEINMEKENLLNLGNNFGYINAIIRKNVYLFNFDYDKCKKMFDEIECEIMFENGYEEINL
jgi:energy-coupling factor transporter ATP-binding protein EcfA2|nr:hypothetical protein [Roseburia sp.]